MAKSKTTEQTVTNAEQPTAEQSQSTTPSLGVQDLITVAQIIQIGAQRGAWRAEEMASVGTLYTKLIAFLQSVGAINQPEPAGSGTEEKK